MLTNVFFVLIICILGKCHAWEEDPRTEENNKRTSYLIKLGNRQIKEKNVETMNLLNLTIQERNKKIEEDESE